MRKLQLLVVGLIWGYVANAQMLNQDAEGKSTLFIEGANIGLDITKTEAAATYNQKLGPWKVGDSRSHQLILGASAKSKNETGIANLFTAGKFVPGGSASARIGDVIRWGKGYEFDTLTARLEIVTDEWAAAVARKDTATAETKDEEADELKGQIFDLTKAGKTGRYRRLIYYLEGGFEASGFNLREEMGSVGTWSALVKKENFVGPFLRGVINYQRGTWLFGGAVGYAKANNLGDLSSEKLALKKTDTLQDGIVTRESSKETYLKSEYRVFDKVTLDFDAVKTLMLGYKRGKPQGFAALNAYFRYGLTSFTGQLRADQRLNHKLNIGGGIHFFDYKGKFLGGFYAQLDDVANWDTKTKLGEKASFGIYTRFNIQAMDNNIIK